MYKSQQQTLNRNQNFSVCGFQSISNSGLSVESSHKWSLKTKWKEIIGLLFHTFQMLKFSSGALAWNEKVGWFVDVVFAVVAVDVVVVKVDKS